VSAQQQAWAEADLFAEALFDRESTCGCAHLVPPLTYGRQGWHYRRNDQSPENPQLDRAFEPCLAYRRGVERRKERER
jgi:hypothetical protein